MKLFEGHQVQLCRFAFDLAVLSPDASADCVRYEFLVFKFQSSVLTQLPPLAPDADSCAQIGPGSHVRAPSVMASSTSTTAWSTSTTEALSMTWSIVQLAGLDQWFFPDGSSQSRHERHSLREHVVPCERYVHEPKLGLRLGPVWPGPTSKKGTHGRAGPQVHGEC